MGKWNSRPSRRKFRQLRSPTSSPRLYDLHASLPEFWQDGIPLWEKKFCTLIGSVPWQKIVDSKKFIYSHSNVLKWNDSAAEEAYQNAKRHYWAKINNLPCDISLPDPDTYVDQIDWNPYIDPELIKELDCVFVAPPDEEERNNKKNERTKSSVNDENPWECNGIEINRGLDNEVQGWNLWDNHIDDSGNGDKGDNPWECSTSHGNRGLTNNAWERGAVKSWGSNQVNDHNNNSRDWDCGYNSWENNCSGILSLQDKLWGKVRDSAWNPQHSSTLVNYDSHREFKSSQHHRAPIGREWTNRGANVRGWKQQENGNISRDLQFRRNSGGWTAWNQSSRKREGSDQYTSGYNTSQFQRAEDHHRRRGNTNKRVSFAPE